MIAPDSVDPSVPDPSAGIAIVGFAGRFPGAADVQEFWENLLAARETIQSFRRDELAPGEPADDPEYITRRGVLDRAEWMDAAFFGMGRVEAEVTDPQQRVFLEIAWTALEHAGYDPHRLPGVCGVWAGTGNNHYVTRQLAANPSLLEAAGPEAVMIGNEKDYIATRVAYRLNLRGPAINVVTACSTSLVAVTQAVQGLLTFQCDMALAGGASIRWPQNRGYRHEEGSIFSPDGHCRAFDEKSAGTVFSSGAGCVVLKRLEDAWRDRDTVYAVIKSAALNNDGAGKVSFTAPGVDGQSQNISMALALANVPAALIDFVEAHGTGTALGDVIEVAALTQAFRADGDTRVGECLLGSLKTATGHMDAAAGVGGLIKAALSLHHGVVPGTLHFQRPNPKLNLEASPFRVSAAALPLAAETTPRRALVAALGVGGTNAHLVLESSPPSEPEPTEPGTIPRLLLLSARSPMALATMQDRLAKWLTAQPGVDLRDVAFTLARGRTAFTNRAAVVAHTAAEAANALRSLAAPAPPTSGPRPIAFLFPGQGSQHAGMARGLKEQFAVFREALESCRTVLGFDPLVGTEEELGQTERTQPALFVLGYALARQFESWGIAAQTLLGHSIGEYVAATLADVFSFEDALRVVVARGRALQAQPPGVMLVVRAAETALDLPDTLDLAAVNAPQLCVVSGVEADIASYAEACAARGVETRRLRTSHAFHSRLMDGARGAFMTAFDGVSLRPPRRRVVSNLTGRELTAAEATSPDYWWQHLRRTVRFGEGVQAIAQDHILLEVGPSNTLTQLARQVGATAIHSLPTVRETALDPACAALAAMGQLWSQGAAINGDALFPDGSARRLALPTYPFERQRFCPEVDAITTEAETAGRRDGLPSSLPSPALSLQPLFDQGANPAPRPQGTPSATTTETRLARLVRELQAQLLRISGIDVAAHPVSTPFLDLGFDSLFLTQAGTALKKHFGIKITFRQLMEELTSIEALARHLDAHLPPGKFEPETPVAAPPASAAAAPLGSGRDDWDARLGRIEAALTRLTHDPAGTPTPDPFPAPFTVRVRDQKGSDGRRISFGPFKPIETNRDGSLTAGQRAHLNQLIAEYSAKYPRTKESTSRHRDYFADPRAVAGFNPLWKEMVFPVVTDRSEGAHLWDIDGHQWIDVVHGFGSGFFGHRPPFVVEALKAQLDRGFEIGPTHPLAGEVARLIAEFSGQDRVAFSNTGSESLMAALRVARTVTGRDKVVMFAGAYHGIFDEVLTRPLVVDGELRAIPIAPGIPESAQANIIVLEYGQPESLEIIRRHGPELAAVLVEPVPSRRPDIAPVAFVQELRQITAECQTALVFDEVVLGWRIGPHGAQRAFGIDADLVAYGKVVGGGLPLGILAGKRRFMDALDGGTWRYGDASAPEVGVTFFAGTFIRHPLTLAACKVVLDRLRTEGPALQAAVDARTENFVDALNAVFLEAGVPITVTRYSSLWMLNADPKLKFFSLLFYHLRLRGVHIWEGRGNFLSTAHTEGHCAEILEAFRQSVLALQAGGFFPALGDQDKSPVDLASSSLSEPAAPLPVHPTPPIPLPIAAISPPVTDTEDPATLPLTPEQQELFLSARLGPDSSVAAHESVTLRLRGPLDRARLEQAINALAARHQALRVSFTHDGSRQRVDAGARPVLIDLDADRLEEEITAHFNEAFDLTRAPLWRIGIASHAPDSHALVITAHHLICDGWSFGVIAHELPRLYRGETLPPAVPLLDVATAERDEAAAAYWTAQFSRPPVAVALPTCRPRPLSPDLTARSLRGSFSQTLPDRLNAFCRGVHATPNTVLLAAWQILLHRLTDCRDIVVGTPIAGQLASGRTAIVAHQVHFLPLRMEVDPAISVSELIHRTRGQLADATDHQDYTLGQLYQAVSVPRLPGRPSFVSTTFTCEAAPRPERWDEGLVAELTPNPKRKIAFDASLFIILDGEAVHWQIVFQNALFDEATVAHWMRCLESVIEAMIAQPTLAVGRLNLLAPVDERLILETWNQAASPPPSDASLPALFAEQVARTPDAIAVLWKGGAWSYRELDERANQFAHELRAAGVGLGQLVPLCVERSPQMVAALLGILKAGGAYAPLDPTYPNDRLASLLSDLEPSVIMCDPKQRDRLNRLVELPASPCIEVTSIPTRTWKHHTAAPEVTLPSTSPAYLIFTSGSTGQPKGTVVPHRAVARLVHGQEFAAMDAEQTWLQLAPLSFDACTLEIFAPLLHGGRLALIPSGQASLPQIGDAIRDHGVTSLWLTAGLFQLMVNERLNDLAPLRQLLTGGDVVSVAHARRVLTRFPHLRLVNGYGPTENTTFTCCHVITSADLDQLSLPIGRPLAHTTVFIVDENDHPCPVGVAGELITGGLGLADGYWRREELTARKFVDHPRFGRVYRTGDRARWRLVDGDSSGHEAVVEFLGRLDTQIKVRGFRIEPGEVETALVSHPGVRQAAVRVRGATSGDRRLVAWWVPSGEVLPATSDLRAHLRRSLPEYMIPHFFVPVPDALPLTPNGKLDERSLPDLEDANAVDDPVADTVGASAPPRNDVQRRLCRLMEKALGRCGFGVREDFFELGGDSLRGLHFFNLIEREFGRSLPLGTLFTAPTVEKLATALRGAADTLPPHVIPIQPNGHEPPLFLIHGGDGGVMFYRAAASRLDPDQPVYAIEARMLTDASLTSPGDSIGAVANQYLELVRKIQPSGPYRLGGYSFGGVVAYEMAHRLRAQGEAVDHLFLFDTDNPAVPPRFFSRLGRIAARWRIDRAAGLNHARCLASLARRFWSGLLEQRQRQWELAAVETARTTGRRANDMIRPLEVREANVALMEAYLPPPTDDGITLFRCRDLNDKFEHSPALGWEGVVRGHLDVIPVTGTHLELFQEPHVTLLAQRLAACLRPRHEPLPVQSIDLVLV
ncbi:MAG: amino acid adenylation domain-containing protein [Verrucomicrobiales bacterium]